MPGSELKLNLVYNPVGPSLPPAQAKLEADYKQHLREEHGIEFHQLLTITNMPIHRFEEDLQRQGKHDAYMELLKENFNPATLNGLGYGMPGSRLMLNLVYNPVGPSLPPPQAKLEADYKQHLREEHGIEFHHLLTITNMPIHRFEEDLQRQGKHDAYMELLRKNFNPATLHGLMCRSLVSIGYDGKLYDCDFNQMLDLELEQPESAATVWDVETFTGWAGRRIATAGHCFGCAAGAGSSCTGALA